MSDHLRPRRSVLYMPGANERALEKARTLPADTLILDLEDAVAPDAKVDARQRVCAAAGSDGYGAREIVIRVNGLDTPWHADDLAAAAEAGPDAVLVPKINSAAEVHAIEAALEAAGAPDTHRHLGHARDTGGGAARRGDHHRRPTASRCSSWAPTTWPRSCTPSRSPAASRCCYGLSTCLLAARHAGKVIVDGVYNDITDAAGFEAECVQGRQLGFDGKTLIHPSQLEPCNRVFAPERPRRCCRPAASSPRSRRPRPPARAWSPSTAA